MAPGGRHVEMLGSYDPHSKKAVLKAERINYWVGKGAQISDSVYNLLIKQGIIKGEKRPVKMRTKIKAGGEVKAEDKPRAEIGPDHKEEKSKARETVKKEIKVERKEQKSAEEKETIAKEVEKKIETGQKPEEKKP